MTTHPNTPVVFVQAAREHADRVALLADDGQRVESVSYRRLYGQACGVAQHLARAGLGPEDRVALAADRTPAMIAWILGTMLAGCAYVPYDTTDPRTPELLALARVDAVAGPAEPAGPRPVRRLPPTLLDEPAERPPQVCIDERALVYLIFTSGSTGPPKPVAIPHGALAHFVAWARESASPRPGDAFLQFASLTFDASVWEVFTPLTTGATLVLPSVEVTRSPTDLAEVMARHRVTHADLPGAVLQSMDLSALPAFRFCITGAEPVPPRTIRHCAAPGRRILNGYGPTEATDMTVAGDCDPAQEEPHALGLPVGQTTAHVLDAAGDPVEVGELHLGGPQLARGYDGRPGLTADRFRPDPWSAGGRLYATGDIVRRLPDERLLFLGRADRQVKVRGHRVELDEVESALTAHPAAVEAAVVAPVVAGARRLVAHVVTDAPLDELRGDLARRLPPWLLPTAWLAHEHLPRGRTGKVDRRALETMGIGAARPPVESALPGPLGAAVRELLGAAASPDTTLLELGGDSLDAIRITARLRDAGLRIDPRILLSAVPLGRVPVTAAPPLPEPLDGDRAGEAPLTAYQIGLWYLHLLRPASAAYHVPVTMDLTGPLDPERFDRAWRTVVRHHQVLRCRIDRRAGRPWWVLTDDAPPLRHEDLRSTDDPAAALADLARGQHAEPFDLAAGPAVRATLVRLDGDRHAFVLTIHHLACDGWALGVLAHDLSAAYAAAPLPEADYLAYANTQAAQAERGDHEAGVRYWQALLATNQPQTAAGKATGVPVGQVFDLPGDRLRAEFARLRVTPFVGWLSIFARAVRPADTSTPLPVGVMAANRLTVDTERLVGMLTNTIALPVPVAGGATETAARLRDLVLASLPHWDTPLPLVMSALSPTRGTSGQPLFRHMFEFDNTPPAAFHAGDLTGCFSDEGLQQGAVSDLSLRVFDRGEDFRCVLVGDAATVDRQLLDRARRGLDQSIADLLGTPHLRQPTISTPQRPPTPPARDR